MVFNESAFYGKLVEFTDRFNQTWRGVVVKTTVFPHCHGANDYTVYVEDDQSSRVYGLPLGGFKVVGEGGQAAIQQAREHYRGYLMQYPAWQKNFAQGAGFGW